MRIFFVLFTLKFNKITMWSTTTRLFTSKRTQSGELNPDSKNRRKKTRKIEKKQNLQNSIVEINQLYTWPNSGQVCQQNNTII